MVLEVGKKKILGKRRLPGRDAKNDLMASLTSREPSGSVFVVMTYGVAKERDSPETAREIAFWRKEGFFVLSLFVDAMCENAEVRKKGWFFGWPWHKGRP